MSLSTKYFQICWLPGGAGGGHLQRHPGQAGLRQAADVVQAARARYRRDVLEAGRGRAHAGRHPRHPRGRGAPPRGQPHAGRHGPQAAQPLQTRHAAALQAGEKNYITYFIDSLFCHTTDTIPHA